MPTTNSTYNQVTVRQDKHGNIELKIPSHYAQQIWNQRQKKINFGGKATDVQDLAEAEKVAEQLQQDLENGTFHPDNLHQYRHPRKRKRNFKVNQSLLELYDHWVDQTKREGCPSGNKEVSKTGEKRYRGQFRRVVQRLPQDFSSKKKQQDIAISLAQNNGRDTQLRILEQLSSLLKWLQDKEMIPDNVPNYFQQLKKEVGKPPRRGCPAALEGKEQFRDNQKIAWTEEERDLIIRAIQQRYIWSSYYKECDVIGLLIEFLFHTGLRHCELFALRWDRINFCEKGIQCVINQSYNTQYKHIKETKTGKSRNIWLDERAREIIRTLRDFYQSKNRSVTGNSLVFQKSNGNRYDSTDLNRIWYGEHTEKRKKFMGVARLVAAQELPQYLDAYSTRRTFTSLQINAGHNPYTVADYIGDNIDTVIKHYYQGQRVDGAIPYLGFQA